MNNPIPSIFDLSKDDNGVLRMPFNPIDYGENNDIERNCHDCGKSCRQGEMKELGSNEKNERAYHDDKKWWPHSIFFCKSCWESSDYSDASKWMA